MTSNSIERAKLAINAKSDADFARWLGFATSVIAGYRKRDAVPLEQCIKIAEQTGVSLDWLILGKGEMYPENRAAQLPADVKMLITGWQALNTEQKTEILHAILTKI
jgi:Bacteriophage CI repressor helix-turn-helix domain.